MTEPKITWYISEVTPMISRRAYALEESIRAACPVDPADKSRLTNFTYFLAATRKIDYPPTARASVREFAAFLTKWQEMDRAQVWQFCLDNIPGRLWQLWDEAFDDAQSLFDEDPAELPDAALTPEQRTEAETPGSPLASNGASLR